MKNEWDGMGWGKGKKEGTYGSTSSKALNESTLCSGFGDFIHGVFPLDDLEPLEAGSSGGGESLTGEFEDGAAGDAVEDEFVGEWGGDKFELVGGLVAPDDKEVGGAGFGDVAFGAEQPEDLVEALLLGFVRGEETVSRFVSCGSSRSLCADGRGNSRGSVVGSNLCISPSSGPGTNSLTFRREELHGLCIERRERRANDVQQRLSWLLDSQSRMGRNRSRSDVKERAWLCEPLSSVGCDQLVDELDEFLGVKGRECNACGRHQHAGCVQLGTE